MVVGQDTEFMSPHIGHLPDTVGGPHCPKKWEEPPSDQVGRGGSEGGGEVEAGQDWCP